MDGIEAKYIKLQYVKESLTNIFRSKFPFVYGFTLLSVRRVFSASLENVSYRLPDHLILKH
jgi:hypothetical protein